MDRNAIGYLYELNRSMDGVLAMLEKLAEYPELQKDHFEVLKAHFREQLGNANMIVFDALEESEQDEMYAASKARVAYEKEIRDPDDCYLNVLHREEELRSQGLPSNIGILLNMRRITREDVLSETFAEDDETVDEETSEPEADEEQASL